MSRVLAAQSRPPIRLVLASLLACAAISLAVPHSAFADDDPPSRVGRLAVIDGTVSFHTADQKNWGAATPNYPLTTGNALWADSNSHAAVQIGANDLNLGSQTELDIDQLTDQSLQASLPQGSLYLNLRGLNQGDQYQIATPRGAVSITQPGRYEISSGDQSHPSQVTVLEGAAQISGDNNLNLSVGAGQSGILSDDGQGGPVRADLGAASGEDNLIAWARSRVPQAAPPQEAAAMTGTQDLGRYGNWSSTPDYGAVWYPQVAADWVPYRAGHWAWVAPWGWTWVDDAPWGFAPFHYGRWVQIGPRWAWAPRPIVVVEAPVVPVYAPALVSFVGDIGGVGIGISIGGPSVGWVPLGPREVYYPSYRCSPRYARNVNITYVKNVNIINVHKTTIVNNNVTVNRFVNHGAVTVVNRDVMARSQHVAGAVQHVDQRDLERMHGFNGDHAPVAPTAQTVGLTSTDAEHYGVAPQAIHQNATAGPTIKEHNARNWNNQSPQAVPAVASGKNNNVRGNNPQAQQQGLQNGEVQNAQGNKHWSNQNKWANQQGSRQPGAPVAAQSNSVQPNAVTLHDQQKPAGGQAPLTATTSQQVGNQQGGGQITNDQKQHKSNWSSNQQSHQPGAPVQSSSNNGWQTKQQNGKQPEVTPTVTQPSQRELKQQNQNQWQQNQAHQQQYNQQQVQKQQAQSQKQWQQQQQNIQRQQAQQQQLTQQRQAEQQRVQQQNQQQQIQQQERSQQHNNKPQGQAPVQQPWPQAN